MTKVIDLDQIKTRDELAAAYKAVASLSKEFPSEKHWQEVLKEFKVKAQQMGLSWKNER